MTREGFKRKLEPTFTVMLQCDLDQAFRVQRGMRIVLTMRADRFGGWRLGRDLGDHVGRGPEQRFGRGTENTRAVVSDRFLVQDANLLQGIAWHPDGEYALITLNRTKNLVPMTRLMQGWTITNGIGLLWADGRVDQLLLDEPNQYFADVADVSFSPDGGTALVTSSGTDRVAVIEHGRLIELGTADELVDWARTLIETADC